MISSCMTASCCASNPLCAACMESARASGSCKLGVGTSHRIHMNRKLRIAVDCRIEDSQQGVGTAVLALAKALSDSNIEDQEYTFIVREDMRNWLAPYVYGPCRLVGIPVSKFSTVKAALRWIAPLRFIWHKLRGRMAQIPVSDGYVETQQFDVVHFPTQAAYLTELPSIYQPWDLQHLHYPQFFSKADFDLRERYYRAFCDRASCVCVQAEWTKQDVIKHYGLPVDKVAVIPWGSVFAAYETPSTEAIRATAEKYGLPNQFFFYPAATWPHKNHELIFEALYILKSEHGIAPDFYFSGSSKGHRAVLDKLATDLGISSQVHFLGFVTPEELQSVFGAATAMVFASKFEGFGLPILEAFHARLPVISSNATTLPEVAGDAALYFDPDSPTELASLMKAILDAPELREELIRKGSLVLSQHTIDDTAAEFQALYERIAALSSQEVGLAAASAAT
jgi:glycosyltransferase involved in cell wall biosynthesis